MSIQFQPRERSLKRLDIAFTDRQLSLLLRFTNQPPPVMRHNPMPGPRTPLVPQGFQQPQFAFSPGVVQRSWPEVPVLDRGTYATVNTYELVAQDFGLDPSLVHALAERLSLHSSVPQAPFGRY